MKIFAGRSNLIGDLIGSLAIPVLLKKKYPNCHITFPVAKKSKQAVRFIQNHPAIDDIILSEDEEGNIYKINGIEYNQKVDKMPFDLQVNCNPEHTSDYWFNFRDFTEENLFMAGFSLEDILLLDNQELKPFLVRDYSTVVNLPKTITFQTTAGYGVAADRSPSPEWWHKFFDLAKEDLPEYTFLQVGHSKDYKIEGLKDIFEVPFYEQFDYILGSDLYLGLENGIGWINGAYGKVPMVNLLTNVFPGHNQNFFAWEPKHRLNKSLSIFAKGGCSNIKHEEVFACIDYFLGNN